VKSLVAAALVALTVASSPASGATNDVVAPGAGLGTIRIPAIRLVAPLTQAGLDIYTQKWPPELNAGPAHYPDTALPWQPGTVAIAGHRVTHTRPFRWLNQLRRGESIILNTPRGVYRYQVIRLEIVSPTATWVLGWGGPRGHRLVLTACNPPGFAYQRIVAFAVSERR
jgi:sortase A